MGKNDMIFAKLQYEAIEGLEPGDEMDHLIEETLPLCVIGGGRRFSTALVPGYSVYTDTCERTVLAVSGYWSLIRATPDWSMVPDGDYIKKLARAIVLTYRESGWIATMNDLVASVSSGRTIAEAACKAYLKAAVHNRDRDLEGHGTYRCNAIRWSVERTREIGPLYKAYAWLYNPVHLVATVESATELGAMNGLRLAILRYYNQPTDQDVINDLGDVIHVGGATICELGFTE